MADKFQHYYGVIFIGLLNKFRDREFSFKEYPTKSRSSYVVTQGRNTFGIYIKFSQKRITPWSFTFSREHQLEIENMTKNIQKIFIMLVCGNDGVAILSFDEFKKILDENYEENENVTVKRPPRGRYSVSGRDGKLNYKIVKNDYEKLLKTCQPKLDD